jgi:four helix bundle protein
MVKDLSDLEVYILAENFANSIWDIVSRWEYFRQRTIGMQFTRAADSIVANIAEGHGRYHYKDKKNFGYYARGSYEECKNWLRMAIKRNLISGNEAPKLIDDLEKIGPKLNALINTYKKPRSKVTNS